jgi:hypothetical protein
MDFHYYALPTSLNEHDEHAERRSDNYSLARSRPSYTDDFYNEFENRPSNLRAVISDGKNLPPHCGVYASIASSSFMAVVSLKQELELAASSARSEMPVPGT